MPSHAGPYYIGLMSGTSTDGVDGVLANFQQAERPSIIAAASLPFPDTLRAEFLALNHPAHNELERSALAGIQLANLYADVVHQLLRDSGLRSKQVSAIGAHGQTVRHAPDAGYTVQINAPAHLAERTGIAVVADFRSRDIAAGGQGAPLVPIVHQALFAASGKNRVVLNLGGIANVTVLSADGKVLGFDTGPANVLLDTWIQEKKGCAYDRDGQWAASGNVNTALLDLLLASEPWLDVAPPKSTGRHLFNAQWLQARLEQANNRPNDADIQATLQAFTARTVALALARYAPDTQEVIVCGGGALNKSLMTHLAAELPCPVRSSETLGVPVQLVEALAFAWLAHAWDHGVAGGLPAVTGAREPRILGCKYPA